MGGFVSRVIKRAKPKQKPIAQTIQKVAVKKSPAGPTTAELAQQRMSSIKRRGRKSTNLGVSDEDLTLSYRTLLG
tara:strand:- start:111 stop:335 length:225 start_codon:yes stop_codon:yes gene_type:complete